MLLFQYLNALPIIPTHLLNPAEIPDETLIGFGDSGYTRWAPNHDLKNWLNHNISTQLTLAGVQKINGNVPPHCDQRKWALNYILDVGGPNVSTLFHHKLGTSLIQPPGERVSGDCVLRTIYSVNIQPNRWHLLNTHVLHSVIGLESTRTAITIGFRTKNPHESIKGYTGT